MDYPLIYNEDAGFYEQPANEAVFKYTIGKRHQVNEVQTSINKISESAVYSPPLLQEPNDGDVIQFYRVGATLFQPSPIGTETASPSTTKSLLKCCICNCFSTFLKNHCQ